MTERSENYFANLQTQYDLDLAKETGKNILGKIIAFPGKKSNNHDDILEA